MASETKSTGPEPAVSGPERREILSPELIEAIVAADDAEQPAPDVEDAEQTLGAGADLDAPLLPEKEDIVSGSEEKGAEPVVPAELNDAAVAAKVSAAAGQTGAGSGPLPQDVLNALADAADAAQALATPPVSAAKTLRDGDEKPPETGEPAAGVSDGQARFPALRQRFGTIPIFRISFTILAAIVAGTVAYVVWDGAEPTAVPQETAGLPRPPEPAAATDEATPPLPPAAPAELAPVEAPAAEAVSGPDTPAPAETSAPPVLPEAVTPPEDPAYASLKNACANIAGVTDPKALDGILDAINQFIEMNPVHAKMPEAMEYKALVYEQKQMPIAALDLRRQIIKRFPNDPDLPTYVLNAAQCASRVRREAEAIPWLERLVTEQPGFQRIADAELLLANAYRAAGRMSDASALYAKLIQTRPGTRYESESTAALADIALSQARYEDAVRLLEPHAPAGTAQEGGDLIRLNLARGYAALNRLEDAHRVLNELVSLYPESTALPGALCLLANVLDRQGRYKDAVELATEAARRFPAEPAVIRTLGELLRAGDDKKRAAETLARADASGAGDPGLLLVAARDFASAGAARDAEAAYRRLIAKYPQSSEAFEGKLELGALLCETGKPRDGIRFFEELAKKTEKTPQHLPVLLAMGKAFHSLGLNERSSAIYRQVAAISSEPQVLASAANALLDAGVYEDGMAIASRVDVTKIPAHQAALLTRAVARGLAARDAPRAAQLLEQIRTQYPGEWTSEMALDLLKLYLQTGNIAEAENTFGRMRTQLEQRTVEPPAFREAAMIWADYLMRAGRVAEAAQLYGQVAGFDKEDEVGLWAQYHEADALARLKDFEGALALYEKIAASSAPFAKEAGLKASNLRIELCLAGLRTYQKDESDGE